ncbi:TetR family transcriptional regulator [Agromyces atrinae]|uniref:TetR/AcrR family transcriptional regulator n=1 Tax=Agromyces atrinae TaxID=592376 RepID=UPI001F566260|nr:TetR family transcriptional regulator [Agromyces atrinae]MCI2956872.1 TetR family transcriptional regulator [Agromyces atrinae]
MSDVAGVSDDVRRALRDSSDPRAERTRQRLFEAAEALSATGDDVSVSALVRQAGVSRSVFYTHFADVGELALRMIEPVIDEIAQTAAEERLQDPHRAMRAAQTRLVAHVDGDRALYRAAFRLPGDGLMTAMRDAMRVPIAVHIEVVGAPDGLDVDLVSRYVAGAVIHLLSDWVLDRVDADPETIAQHLYALMPTWMHEHPNGSST